MADLNFEKFLENDHFSNFCQGHEATQNSLKSVIQLHMIIFASNVEQDLNQKYIKDFVMHCKLKTKSDKLCIHQFLKLPYNLVIRNIV